MGKAEKIKRNKEAKIKAIKKNRFKKVISNLKDENEYRFFVSDNLETGTGKYWKDYFSKN